MKTFLTYTKPLLCTMIQDPTPEEMICTINNALYDGAEAFGIPLDIFTPENRNLETIKTVFDACRGKPIYITSYRNHPLYPMTDDACADLLLLGLEAGATLCDIMSDMYAPDADEMTYDPVAVEKQKALAKKIKEKGGEVLFSAHLHTKHLTEEQVLEYARAQKERGADICKIVNLAFTKEESMEDFHAVYRLSEELDCKFLFLENGPHCRLLRQIGPNFGVCMYLCVQDYKPFTSKDQPLLRSMRLARDNMPK